MQPRTCALIGLGEAGRIYASALHGAGHRVRGYDPIATDTPPGVARAATAAEAVAEADLVLVLTGARAAASVAQEVLSVMRPGALYADMTSSQPEAKRTVAAASTTARVVDVAILGAVIALREKTPLMVSGAGAEDFAAVARSIGAPVTVIDGDAGVAMQHKLIRSVFMKGLASVVIEAADAADQAGIGTWIRNEMAQQLAGDGLATIARFESGTRKHAQRRSQEMQDVCELLSSLGVSHRMSVASSESMKAMISSKGDAS